MSEAIDAPRWAAVPGWVRPAPTVFLLAWGGNHFTPLLHLYESAGHYDAWQANLLLGLYVGGLVPGLLVASALSDRYGRKPLLAVGALLAMVGSALLASGLHDFWLLGAGRAFAGAGVGIAMSVGTSWMKELSSPPFEQGAGTTAGARRPALTLTLGFGIGAAVTGVLAQWGPAPTATPYLVHLVLTALALGLLATAPESLRPESRATGAWWRDLRIPSVGHRRFVAVVLPAAPWVFAAAGVAYAIMPAIAQQRLGDWTTSYATGLTVLTLGTGALVQNLVPRLDRRTNGGALVVGLALMTAGMALAVVAAAAGNPAVALGVAVLLGAAYGICLVAGLIQVQAIATAQDLAGLTGVYCSLTYAGFLLPALLAGLLPVVPYTATLAVVATLCLGCLALVARAQRRTT